MGKTKIVKCSKCGATYEMGSNGIFMDMITIMEHDQNCKARRKNRSKRK